ncbi:hypothetical protein THIOM_004108, partial [Candidatus Thiomargarita nelsonii]
EHDFKRPIAKAGLQLDLQRKNVLDGAANPAELVGKHLFITLLGELIISTDYESESG